LEECNHTIVHAAGVDNDAINALTRSDMKDYKVDLIECGEKDK